MADKYGDGWHQGLVQAEAIARGALQVFDGDDAAARMQREVVTYIAECIAAKRAQGAVAYRIAGPGPIPMRLTCPACGELHLDEGDFATKPHHTHACQACGMVWRPAVVATVGVAFLPGFKNEEDKHA